LRDEELFAQVSGQHALPIYASAKDKFFYRVVAAQIEFERDTTGKITALIFHQNGKDLRATIISP
jgi:D-alanyl-D-alanine-carboxypeptidase/D-alanyl-D-alanine-endopeptidase